MANYDKITLAEIREAVRGKLDDDAYDGDTIDQAANDFQNELFTTHRIRFMESTETLTVSDGDTDLDFPVDFLTMLSLVAFDSVTQYRDIQDEYVNYNDFMRHYANFQIATPQRLQTWTEFGEGIRFSNPSDADYSVLLDYLRMPELMVNDSDESEVKNVYKEMMVLGTLARVMEVNEDYAEASQEREKLDPLVTTFVAREGRGQLKVGPKIIGTRRGRVGGYRADRDF